MPSSSDLHPVSGARFVFSRQFSEEPTRFELHVHLPDGVTYSAIVDVGQANVPVLGPAEASHRWVVEEAVKLMRVLRREPRDRLTRWRPNPAD